MTFRYARHTNDLKSLIQFYTEILGFEKLGEFNNHENYNGFFLGLPNLDWHIEFTESNEQVNHQPDADDLLVFYLETEEALEELKIKIKEAEIPYEKSKNPYWTRNGIEIKDPDGFGVILTCKK